MTPRSRLLRQLWLVVFGVLVVAALAPRVRVTPERSTTPSSLVLERPRPIAAPAPDRARPRGALLRRNGPPAFPRAALAERMERPGPDADGRHLYLLHQALLC